MVQFVHPAKEDVTLQAVLAALADPMRLRIVRAMVADEEAVSCSKVAPCPLMAKSTLSHHFRVLREAGIIRTSKKGVEHCNVVRKEELNVRFPGLLKLILKLATP